MYMGLARDSMDVMLPSGVGSPGVMEQLLPLSGVL
jgi:hypothetical protein